MTSESEAASEDTDMGYANVVVTENHYQFRASSFGNCDTALIAEGIGFTPEPLAVYMEEVFEKGREREPVILRRLRDEHGMDIMSVQKEIVYSVTPEISIIGHIDAIVRYRKKIMLVEIKTANAQHAKQYAKYKLANSPVASYPWQVSIYRHALGESVEGTILVVQEKIDNPETDPIKLYAIADKDIPKTPIEIGVRAMKLVNGIKHNQDNPNLDTGPLMCTETSDPGFCSFKYLHAAKTYERFIDPDVAIYGDLKRQERELAKRIKTLNDDLKARYKDDPRAASGFDSGKYHVVLSTVTKEVLDQRAVMDYYNAANIDIPMVKSSYQTLNVTEIKEKDQANVQITF